MWGAFNPHSGMPYETGFPYNSETGSVLGGFIYGGDLLRINTSTFYHLSYLIGEALGIGGSYVPFQAVYALLWWARGFLAFLLLRKFLPHNNTVCYVAGALVLAHASDGALEWVGQLNQFGFIFWMLLAFYVLSLAFETAGWRWAIVLCVAACFFEFMSLWSYESQILLLLLFPFALLLHPRRAWQRWVALSAAWYAAPALYIALALRRYMQFSGNTYQESVMRKSWSLASLLGDWSFNIGQSLKFWSWTRGGWRTSESQAALLSLLAASIFIVGGVAVIRLGRRERARNVLGGTTGTWCILLAAGLSLLVLSFPVYLLLDSARGLWRTQFLSGIGAGLTLTAVAGLASRVLWRPFLRGAVFLLFGGVVVWFGSLSAIQKGAFHRWVWERHRSAILQVLQVAPSVKPNTVVVLEDVPKNNDPFGHNMWFDMAIRLVYPGIPASGIYFYTDGTPSPGNNIKADGDRWKWDGTGYPPVVQDASIADTIIIRFEPSGNGKLEETMPSFLCQRHCALDLYNPVSAISGPISPRTVRRYRPDSAF